MKTHQCAGLAIGITLGIFLQTIVIGEADARSVRDPSQMAPVPPAPRGNVGIGFPRDLLRCESQSECTVEQGICGAWYAVNKRFVPQVKDAFQRLQVAVECSSYQQTTAPQVSCAAELCEIKGQNPSARMQTEQFQKACPEARGETYGKSGEDIIAKLQHPLPAIRDEGLQQIVNIRTLSPSAKWQVAQQVAKIYVRSKKGEEQGLATCWFGPTSAAAIRAGAMALGDSVGPVVDAILHTQPTGDIAQERTEAYYLLGDIGPSAARKAEATINLCLKKENPACIYAARKMKETWFSKNLMILVSARSALSESALMALYGILEPRDPDFRRAVLLALKNERCETANLALRIMALESEVFKNDSYTVVAAGKTPCNLKARVTRTLQAFGSYAQTFVPLFPPNWSRDPALQDNLQVWKALYSSNEIVTAPELIKEAYDSFGAQIAGMILRELDTPAAKQILVETGIYWATGQRQKDVAPLVPQLTAIATDSSKAVSERMAALQALYYAHSKQYKLDMTLVRLLEDPSDPIRWEAAGMLLRLNRTPNGIAIDAVMQAMEKGGYVRGITTLQALEYIDPTPEIVVQRVVSAFRAAPGEESGAIMALMANRGVVSAQNEIKALIQNKNITALKYVMNGFSRLKKLPPLTIMNPLKTLLSDTSTFVTIADELERLRQPVALDAIRVALKDPARLK